MTWMQMLLGSTIFVCNAKLLKLNGTPAVHHSTLKVEVSHKIAQRHEAHLFGTALPPEPPAS